VILSLSFFVLSALPPALLSVQKEMKSVQSFEVSFKQTVKQDLFPDADDSASGSLMFTRPNKMVWKYDAPKKRTIRFDGRELVIEEEGQKQIVRDSGRLSLEKAFSFLWGQPDPAIFIVDSKTPQSFSVKPKKLDDVNFQSIIVSVENGRVKEALIIDKMGSESRLQFDRWKLGVR